MLKSFLKNTLVVLASLIVALIMVEGILWTLDTTGIVPIADPTVESSDQYVFFRYDPVLGWNNQAGATGIFSRKDFKTGVHINSLEMREHREFERSRDGRRRIAVTGDSFTWGHGVEESERYTNVAASLFGGGVEIMNFGVTGFGPVQYYLQLDKMLEFDPDVVLLGFCLGNDFHDNVVWRRYEHYYGPYGVLEDDKLKIAGYPIPNLKNFGGGRLAGSHLRAFVAGLRMSKLVSRTRKYRTAKHDGGDWPEQRGLLEFTSESMYDPQNAFRDVASRINKAVLEEIKRKVDEKGVRLAVVVVPTKFEYSPQKSGFDPRAAERALLASLEELGIDHVNGVDVLDGGDFFPDDGHWTAAGHAKLGRLLHNYLSQPEFTGAGSLPESHPNQ